MKTKLQQTVPIYIIDVDVEVFENKVFIRNQTVKGILIKGFGKKLIMERKMDLLNKLVSDKIKKSSKKETFVIQDIHLKSQHSFGVNLD